MTLRPELSSIFSLTIIPFFSSRMFSDRVASMFSVIELFFGIGGQEEFYSRNNLKDVFQVRSLALCWGAFCTKLGDSLSPSRSVCHKGSNVRGNENSLGNEMKNNAVEA